MCVCGGQLCVCVWAYVLMYVKRLVFVYVCEGFSYLCVSVKPVLFVYIRGPFAFWPTLGEDFGSMLCFCLCKFTDVHKN